MQYFSILPGVKESSVILPGSKERRSRQNYFCQVVAMKEESGSHFYGAKETANSRNDRHSCTENVHKIIRARIPFILKNVWDVAITYC